MPTNVYMAPGMLGKKIRHWSNVADPEWAESYLEANFGLWTKEARELLQRLYDDPDACGSGKIIWLGLRIGEMRGWLKGGSLGDQEEGAVGANVDDEWGRGLFSKEILDIRSRLKWASATKYL